MKALYVPLILLSLGLGACAVPAPVPIGYDLTFQHKMQAVHHWSLLADRVAERVHQVLIPPGPTDQVTPLPILYVDAPSELAPFNVAFRELLITHLMQKGFTVSRNPAIGLVLNVEALIIPHEGAPGYGEVPYDELLVNVSLLQGGTYTARFTDVYYIKNALLLYAAAEPSPVTIRRMEVVDQ